MDIAIPFADHALNAVDKKGRVSLPAEMRLVIEARAKAAERSGLPANPNLLLVRKDPSVPCLLGIDQTAQFQIAALQEQKEMERFAAGDDPWARGTGARDFGAFERITFDKAGRMVLSARLRSRVEIGDHAFFIGTRRGIEIWNPRLGHAQYQLEGMVDIVDLIENLCKDKSVAL